MKCRTTGCEREKRCFVNCKRKESVIFPHSNTINECNNNNNINNKVKCFISFYIINSSSRNISEWIEFLRKGWNLLLAQNHTYNFIHIPYFANKNSFPSPHHSTVGSDYPLISCSILLFSHSRFPSHPPRTHKAYVLYIQWNMTLNMHSREWFWIFYKWKIIYA
jgi:hypothetical protein